MQLVQRSGCSSALERPALPASWRVLRGNNVCLANAPPMQPTPTATCIHSNWFPCMMATSSGCFFCSTAELVGSLASGAITWVEAPPEMLMHPATLTSHSYLNELPDRITLLNVQHGVRQCALCSVAQLRRVVCVQSSRMSTTVPFAGLGAFLALVWRLSGPINAPQPHW